MASETDPLMPKSSTAPEIMSSRPQSTNGDFTWGDMKLAEIEGRASDPERKAFKDLIIGSFVGFMVIVLVFVVLRPDSVSEPSEGGSPHWQPKTIEQRVNRILSTTPLIDGHNDLAILIRYYYNNHLYGNNFTKLFEEGGMPAHVDLPRLKAGKYGGAFWAAFGPCPKDGQNFSDENYVDSVAFTYNQIDMLRRLQTAYPDHFSPPADSSNALTYFRKKQLISPIAIEGLHQIGNSLSNLRNYHALGVRYATLTHNCHNIYADAALLEVPGGVAIAPPLHNGVSQAGQTIISEMNRLGMLVDLSHVSAETMRDVLGGSESKNWAGSAAPPIFSHSSAYAICPHPRNVRDDVLQLVKKRNSIVMVNFSPDFVSCTTNPSDPEGLPLLDKENSTMEHVADHIMYIGNLIGFDHVGLGSDFDGIMSVPKGLEDVSKFPDLVAELLRRGVSDGDVGKIVGGNILRVWKAVDALAEDWRKKGVKPAEDDLPPLKV